MHPSHLPPPHPPTHSYPESPGSQSCEDPQINNLVDTESACPWEHIHEIRNLHRVTGIAMAADRQTDTNQKQYASKYLIQVLSSIS